MLFRSGSFVGDWWRLVVPYFRSEERWIALALLVGAIGLTFGAVGLEVLFNDWNRRFYDSIQNKDEAAFWREITIFSVLAAVVAGAPVVGLVVLTILLEVSPRRKSTSFCLVAAVERPLPSVLQPSACTSVVGSK